MAGIVTVVSQPFAQQSLRDVTGLPDWMPVAVALIAAGYGVRRLRGALAGFAAGVAAHLAFHAAANVTPIHWVPFDPVWLLVNAALCLGLAHLASVDRPEQGQEFIALHRRALHVVHDIPGKGRRVVGYLYQPGPDHMGSDLKEPGDGANTPPFGQCTHRPRRRSSSKPRWSSRPCPPLRLAQHARAYLCLIPRRYPQDRGPRPSVRKPERPSPYLW